jgi:alkylation response protein AidB-like acyl-CoA dehydrogenase
MDFELSYTAEQEEFRKEVRAWFDANIPPNLDQPEDPSKIPYELYQIAREFRRKLGEKGWLVPTFPKEHGGGGLSVAHAIVLAEEQAEREDIPRFFGDNGVSLFIPAIMVWGTDEQKQRFLPPMCRGEVITWQGYTEPEAGSDLASLKLRATREGDEYVLNGEKIFIGASYDVDYIFTLAVTDPSRPRHQNIGAFMVPAHLPGISVIDLDLFSEAGQPGKRHIFYEDVRVPATHLIGGETDGWQVTQSVLEVEHGGGGTVVQRHRLLERVIDYCKETRRNGQLLSKDPEVRQALVEIYVRSEIGRLWGLRNYWMRHAQKRGVGHEGSQTSLRGKTDSPKIGTLYLQILGPAALLNDAKWGPLRGAMELQQRNSICTHPGGTPEIQKVIIARRMGLSRTREQAASFV